MSALGLIDDGRELFLCELVWGLGEEELGSRGDIGEWVVDFVSETVGEVVDLAVELGLAVEGIAVGGGEGVDACQADGAKGMERVLCRERGRRGKRLFGGLEMELVGFDREKKFAEPG